MHTQHPVSSWGFGALLKGLTSVLNNSYRSRNLNPQPQVTSPTLYPLGHDCPHECMSAASIALEVAEGECQLVSAQTIRHTLQQVSLHGRRPKRKPLLKLAHKKACKQFSEDNLAKSMNYWNHVLWSDDSKVNLFDSDGVQHVW